MRFSAFLAGWEEWGRSVRWSSVPMVAKATPHNGDSPIIVQGEGLTAMTAALTPGVEIGDNQPVQHQDAGQRLPAFAESQVPIASRARAPFGVGHLVSKGP